MTAQSNLPRFLEDDACHQPGQSSPAAMTAATSTSHAHVESKHRRHNPVHDEDSSDDVTTAYSSWIEENSSQLSSCPTSRERDDDDDSQLSCPQTIVSRSSGSLLSARDAEEVDGSDRDEADSSSANEDDDDAILRRLSLSSSYYSAVTSQREPATDGFGDGSSGEFGFEPHPAVVVTARQGELRPHSDESESASDMSSSTMENYALYELTERARHMLRRERSADYKIDDYFFHQWGDSALLAGCPYSPIDTSCRSKMMEWSLRVLEYSFPCPSSTHHPRARRPPRRKYSIQAIQIVSQAFALVDRLATRHFRQNYFEAMDRSQYKLVCMGCLHLTAKSCGLFGLYDRDVQFEMEEEDSPSCEGGQPSYQYEEVAYEPSRQEPGQEEEHDACCCYIGQDSTSSLSLSSMACRDPHTSTTPSYECGEGQTILPTPALSRQYDNEPVHEEELSSNRPPKSISVNEDANQALRQKSNGSTSQTAVLPRPPLNILSLTGLCTLCQNEYSSQQLIDTELHILKTLDWKLTSLTSVDWCQLLLDVLVHCANAYGETGDKKGIKHDLDMDGIRECTLAGIECVMVTNFMFAPSLVALAAVEHALDQIHDGHEFELQCIVSMYKKIVGRIVSHGVEDLTAVRLCF